MYMIYHNLYIFTTVDVLFCVVVRRARTSGKWFSSFHSFAGVTLITASDYRPLSGCHFWPLAAKSDSRR